MVLNRNSDIGETMPQTVPSAGFTPPCDYTNFAENFDLSLLPSSCDDDQLSYQQQSYQIKPNPKIFTTYYPTTSQPDFQILLENDSKDKNPSSGIYLQLPITNSDKQQQQQQQQLSPNSTSTDYGTYRQSYETNFYPSSPELSLYTPSPNSIYSRSPCDDFPIINATMNNNNNQKQFGIKIKEENFLSPCNFSAPASPATSYSNHSSPGQHYPGDVIDLLENTVLDKDIKQESTVDFGSILNGFHYSTESTNNNNTMLLTKKGNDKPKDHQLLREALRDTSFQKKFNIKPIDLCIINNDDNVGDIKMEDTTNDDHHNHDNRTNHDNDNQNDIMRDNIEPVLNLAIEQLRKDVDSTCVALGISPDPIQWSQANVLSWLQWTSRQFGLNEPNPDEWNINGTNLLELTENDFIKKSPQGGMILYAQLEIWKAAFSNEEFNPNWMPDTASSNASSGDISDDDDEESTPSHSDLIKPTVSHTNRIGGNSGTNSGSSHIHLWQFLKELLSTPQTHGSCIRWMDRTKGIFKIEDSVKVARLWGKRKNRPAMNYDKLSRSIRQYYKKGIMKKTERSQRLVYQFCHPYNL